MMMPSLTSSSSSSSSSSATVRVEKATSEFLIGPDWTINMDICDAINSNQPLAKDVVKVVKKRLQHKNPKVQLLALTLLETMVKNCGEYVHFQIAERKILQEMIKIVKKKADMHVRDKILMLLDSWQEAFGGPGGKYPQYYWAYDELRRSGIEFPQRSHDTAPIFTPPITHPTPRHPQPGYGMPINSSLRLDEAMAAEVENLSLSNINSMRDVVDLLADMLQAVNPSDPLAIKDEVISDLVEQCRANQKKLMQMLTTTGDEELLAQGLELNDILQSVLAKHEAIASGSPLPDPVPGADPQLTGQHVSGVKPSEVKVPVTTPTANPSAPVLAESKGQVDEDEDDEDDFAQLARRHSKAQPSGSQSTSDGVGEGVIKVNSTTPGTSAIPAMSTALVLSDPLATVKTTKDQDIIDLLSLTLSTSTSSPRAPETSAHSMQSMNDGKMPPTGMGNPYNSQPYPGTQAPVVNSYVAPWAQPQPQLQQQSHPLFHLQSRQQPQTLSQPQSQPQYQSQQESQHQFQNQPQFESQYQSQQSLQSSSQPPPQTQNQYLQHPSAYPPPPWAPTPGYYSNTGTLHRPYAPTTPQTTSTSMLPLATRQLQHVSSSPAKGSNGSAPNGDAHFTSIPKISTPATGPKPFIPSYRLFEDLNVLGNADGRLKGTTNSSPPLSGARNQNMIGERK